MHIDCDENDCSIVAISGCYEYYSIAKIFGRPLIPGEKHCISMDKLLYIDAHGVKKLVFYTLWVPQTITVLPHAEEIVSSSG